MFAARRPLLENKKTNAGFWSKVTFWYLNDFLSLGWSRPITLTDCWEPSDDDKAATITAQLEKEWLVELEKDQPSLSWAVFRANKNALFKTCFVSLFAFSTRLAMPFILRELLRWFALGNEDNSVYIYVTLLLIATGLHALLLPRMLEWQTIVGHQIRVQLIQ